MSIEYPIVSIEFLLEVSSLYVALTSPVSSRLGFVAPESYVDEKIPGNYFIRYTNCRDFQSVVWNHEVLFSMTDCYFSIRMSSSRS